MKYLIYDNHTNKEVGGNYIVTRDGDIAWWDDSQGWTIDEHQDRFIIRLVDADHVNILKDDARFNFIANTDPECLIINEGESFESYFYRCGWRSFKKYGSFVEFVDAAMTANVKE